MGPLRFRLLRDFIMRDRCPRCPLGMASGRRGSGALPAGAASRCGLAHEGVGEDDELPHHDLRRRCRAAEALRASPACWQPQQPTVRERGQVHALTCGGALRGREVADRGARPHPADASAASRGRPSARPATPVRVSAVATAPRRHPRVRPAPDPEVVAKATRRRFTAAYKLSIIEKADACGTPGEIGALLRREGLYSSHLSAWRSPRAGSAKRRGCGRWKRENARLLEELRKPRIIIDVQGKVSGLLGVSPGDGKRLSAAVELARAKTEGAGRGLRRPDRTAS